jgi:hypothetical protein
LIWLRYNAVGGGAMDVGEGFLLVQIRDLRRYFAESMGVIQVEGNSEWIFIVGFGLQ